LDRASGYEPEGREFESLRAHHLINNLGSSNSGRPFDCDRIVINCLPAAISTTFSFMVFTYC
jgi:hypothetical protein